MLPWIETIGKDLEADGFPIHLRGPAWGDLTSLDHFQQLEYRFQLMRDLLGDQLNAVRIAISPAPDQQWKYYEQPELFDPALDQIINLCVEHEIYVMGNFHGMSNPERVQALKADPSPWINWLLHFIERYKDVSNVCAWEIWNEPAFAFATQAEFRPYAEKAYQAIRNVNPNILVVVSSVPFTIINQDWISQPLGEQAVYSWDSYFSKWPYATYVKPYMDEDVETGLAKMTWLLYESKHINADLPILNTEFGWTPTDPLQACIDYYELMKHAENSWFTWWWHGNPDNYGLYDGPPGTLTPHGEIMKNYLSGWPPGFPPVEPEPPTPEPPVLSKWRAVIPVTLLPVFRTLRNQFISQDLHKRLHPWL